MDKWWIMGDVHGDFKPIRSWYKRESLQNELNTNLIILGDFGANYFFNYRDIKFKRQLSKYKITYYVLRGNHEERPSILLDRDLKKEFWTRETVLTDDVCGSFIIEKEFPKIHYLEDVPFTYTLGGKQVLALPGAYSIDKEYRMKMGYSWFPHEQMSNDEMRNAWDWIIAGDKQFDYVISHTYPRVAEPLLADLFYIQTDQSLVDKTMENWMGNLLAEIKYDRWYMGHLHDTRNINAYKLTMLFSDPIPLGETASWICI